MTLQKVDVEPEDSRQEDSSICLTVSASGDRLDRYLSDHLKDLTRSRVQKLIEQGEVWVNGQICQTKKLPVQAGDCIVLTLPRPEPLTLEPEPIPLEILYEDDSLLVVNKPAGLVVHPAPGHTQGTLVHALLAHCETLAGIGGVQRPGIVHRLDKDTSGAIVIAKTDQAHQQLQAQLKAKTAGRIYLGVVYGNPAQEQGTIDLPIGRHPVDRKKMAVNSDRGRQAITHWQVLERFGNYSLLQFQLETGRTHQIRVHSTQIGHPIVGDPVYSSGKSIGINLPGQALHAWKLQFSHPITEKLICVTAPLPTYFVKLLDGLRQRSAKPSPALVYTNWD